MQTNLASEFKHTAQGAEAEEILRKCVHCGFCTATCPTYQILGDELDGPRGRIYLIKQVLEGEAPTRKTQLHLDRCLTCRNCETTCPSGVQYGHLIDIGRSIVESKVKRPIREVLLRALLKHGLSSSLFSPAMKLAQAMRFMLPPSIKAKVPSPRLVQNGWPSGQHQKKVLMLAGCVQPAMQPQINISTARVLDAVGIQTIVAKEAGCCGAVKFHLNDQAGALDQMRNNIDAWWPYVETGVEAIVINASGCSISVKEYGYFLKNDMAYADKARRISDLCRDLTEMLPPIISKLKDKISPVSIERAGLLALHPPCTLQHGLKLRGELESHLRNLGFKVELTVAEQHLCCGSAGTYSVLQPELSNQLRDRKIRHLQDLKPSKIVSANIGCISHLQSGTTTPVRHWIEILDQALAPEV